MVCIFILSVNIDNVIIDKVEKKYYFIPTGYGEGISGPDEKVTNKHVCYLFTMHVM